MQNPLISFIVPVYNREKFLSKCIESIINQTYRNIELILIDDGSTDTSLIICNKYKNIDNRIKIISQSNYGVSHARNVGIQNATGDFIIFVDSDDFISEKLSETLVTIINETKNIDLIIYGFTHVNTLGDILFYETAPNSIDSLSGFLSDFCALLEKNLIRSPVNKLFSKKIIVENNISFNEKTLIAEDALFNIQYLCFVENVRVLKNPYYFVVNHNSIDRLTRKYHPNEINIQNTFFSDLLDFLSKNEILTEDNFSIISKQYNYLIALALETMIKNTKKNLRTLLDFNYKFLLQDLINHEGGYFIDSVKCKGYLEKKYFYISYLCLNLFEQRYLSARNNCKFIKAYIWKIISLSLSPFILIRVLKKWF